VRQRTRFVHLYRVRPYQQRPYGKEKIRNQPALVTQVTASVDLYIVSPYRSRRPSRSHKHEKKQLLKKICGIRGQPAPTPVSRITRNCTVSAPFPHRTAFPLVARAVRSNPKQSEAIRTKSNNRIFKLSGLVRPCPGLSEIKP